MLSRENLHPYQVRTVEFVKANRRAALWLEMGLGKTTSVLTALVDLFAEFEVGRALIVAPKRVARNTWPRELRKWSHVGDLRVAVIRGTEAQRVDVLLADDVELYTIGRELVPWLVNTLDPRARRSRARDMAAELVQISGAVDTLVAYLCTVQPDTDLDASYRWLALVALAGQLRRRRDSLADQCIWFGESGVALAARFRKRWPFDFVALDESSSFKSHRAARWKAIRKTLAHVERLVELTGTPAGKGLLDLWAQIYLIDKGERLEKTFTAFQQRYFTSDYMGYRWTLKPGAEDEIHARLADIVLCLAARDYIDMPELLRHPIEVELPSSARAVYDDLEREYLAQIDDVTVTVAHAAALSNKLLQCANGFVYVTDEENPDAPPTIKYLHDAKLEALQTIVDEHPGKPLLVAYEFRADVPRILEQFPHAVMFDDKPETEDRWNRGDIEMLGTHAASAGHGLTIHDGGNLVAWFGLTWSLELFLQFNARLCRQGQREAVVHLYLITAADTVDDTMVARLESNDQTQGALIRALKSDIRKRVTA